jgi:four helix bundle protein
MEVGMSIKTFESMEIWKQARELTKNIYRISAVGGFAKDYGLRDQIRRAGVSVMSNIAEGFELGGNNELMQFLAIAKGSCGEVRCQLYVALDQNYLEGGQAEQLIDQHRKLSIMLFNFMEYLKKSRFKGQKYKPPGPDKEMVEFEELLKNYTRG